MNQVYFMKKQEELKKTILKLRVNLKKDINDLFKINDKWYNNY